jgi:hypothetical protein
MSPLRPSGHLPPRAGGGREGGLPIYLLSSFFIPRTLVQLRKQLGQHVVLHGLAIMRHAGFALGINCGAERRTRRALSFAETSSSTLSISRDALRPAEPAERGIRRQIRFADSARRAQVRYAVAVVGVKERP